MGLQRYDLYNAIYISLKNLRRNRAKAADEIRREAIVVLSDGDDTSSLIEYDEVLGRMQAALTALQAERRFPVLG